MTQDQYNQVALAVQAAVQQKQAADAQLAAVIQHPAVQQALAIEQQAKQAAFQKQAFVGLNLSDKTTAALLGGGVGALLGGGVGALTASDKNRLRDALIGALLAGSVGAGAGYMLAPARTSKTAPKTTPKTAPETNTENGKAVLQQYYNELKNLVNEDPELLSHFTKIIRDAPAQYQSALYSGIIEGLKKNKPSSWNYY